MNLSTILPSRLYTPSLANNAYFQLSEQLRTTEATLKQSITKCTQIALGLSNIIPFDALAYAEANPTDNNVLHDTEGPKTGSLHVTNVHVQANPNPVLDDEANDYRTTLASMVPALGAEPISFQIFIEDVLYGLDWSGANASGGFYHPYLSIYLGDKTVRIIEYHGGDNYTIYSNHFTVLEDLAEMLNASSLIDSMRMSLVNCVRGSSLTAGQFKSLFQNQVDNASLFVKDVFSSVSALLPEAGVKISVQESISTLKAMLPWAFKAAGSTTTYGFSWLGAAPIVTTSPMFGWREAFKVASVAISTIANAFGWIGTAASALVSVASYAVEAISKAVDENNFKVRSTTASVPAFNLSCGRGVAPLSADLFPQDIAEDLQNSPTGMCIYASLGFTLVLSVYSKDPDLIQWEVLPSCLFRPDASAYPETTNINSDGSVTIGSGFEALSKFYQYLDIHATQSPLVSNGVYKNVSEDNSVYAKLIRSARSSFVYLAGVLVKATANSAARPDYILLNSDGSVKVNFSTAIPDVANIGAHVYNPGSLAELVYDATSISLGGSRSWGESTWSKYVRADGQEPSAVGLNTTVLEGYAVAMRNCWMEVMLSLTQNQDIANSFLRILCNQIIMNKDRVAFSTVFDQDNPCSILWPATTQPAWKSVANAAAMATGIVLAQVAASKFVEKHRMRKLADKRLAATNAAAAYAADPTRANFNAMYAAQRKYNRYSSKVGNSIWSGVNNPAPTSAPKDGTDSILSDLQETFDLIGMYNRRLFIK